MLPLICLVAPGVISWGIPHIKVGLSTVYVPYMYRIYTVYIPYMYRNKQYIDGTKVGKKWEIRGAKNTNFIVRAAGGLEKYAVDLGANEGALGCRSERCPKIEKTFAENFYIIFADYLQIRENKCTFAKW